MVGSVGEEDDRPMSTPPGTETGGATYSGYAPPSPPRPPHRAPWRFVRREDGKLIAGVTTGLADAFGIDVMVVRVLWVIATIFSGGLGIAAYAICWVAFPSDVHPAPITQIHRVRHRSAGYIVGVALLAIGAVVVVGQLVALRPMRNAGGFVWAAFLIGGGVAILFLRNHDGVEHDDREDDRDVAPPPVPMPLLAETPDDAPNAATVAAETAAPADEVNEDATDADANDTALVPPTAPSPPLPPVPPTSSAWGQTAPWPTAPQRRPRRTRPRSFLTPITLSVLLIGAGAAALIDSAGWLNLTVAGVLASGLVVVGLAMVVSTWFGRAHGLIPIGVILLLATIPAVSIDVPISGGIGEQLHSPTTRAELAGHYELGIGHLDLNLVDAPLTGRTTSIKAELGIGELSVNVPTNVRVDVTTHTGAGHTELFGRQAGGWPHDDTAVAGVHQPGVLHLDLEVGAGSIIVRREAPTGSVIVNP
jgi:phage shock protein PspC (stress-responsive transcriptional regulator)